MIVAPFVFALLAQAPADAASAAASPTTSTSTTTVPERAPAVAPATTSGAAHKLRVVVLELNARNVDPDVARTLDESLSVAFGRRGVYDVLTPADLRAVMDVETARNQLGKCDGEGGACMAEIAAALGADGVVHGSIGRLDEQLLLTVNLFDARSNSSVAREQVSGASASALLPKIEPLVATLTRAWVGEAQPAMAVAVDEGGPSALGLGLLLGGAGAAVLGGVAAGAGAWLWYASSTTLDDARSSGDDKVAARSSYTLGLALGGAGAVVLVAGAAAAGAALFVE